MLVQNVRGAEGLVRGSQSGDVMLDRVGRDLVTVERGEVQPPGCGWLSWLLVGPCCMSVALLPAQRMAAVVSRVCLQHHLLGAAAVRPTLMPAVTTCQQSKHSSCCAPAPHSCWQSERCSIDTGNCTHTHTKSSRCLAWHLLHHFVHLSQHKQSPARHVCASPVRPARGNLWPARHLCTVCRVLTLLAVIA